MNNLQKLIQNLISQRIILENDLESVSINCDQNGCLTIVHDPTGKILFNSCQDILGSVGLTGPAGIIVDGTIGLSPIGPTGPRGDRGSTGATGFDGFKGSIGFVGPTGFVGISEPGIQPPKAPDGENGTDAEDKLNYLHLKLSKLTDSPSVNFSPSSIAEYNIEYTNTVYSEPTFATLYSFTTRRITALYTGFYRIDASINIVLKQTSINPADYILQIRFQNGAADSLSTWRSYGPQTILSTTGIGNYNIQLYHSDILSINAGIFYAKLFLTTPNGVSGNITQMANESIVVKPVISRDSNLSFNMIST